MVLALILTGSFNFDRWLYLFIQMFHILSTTYLITSHSCFFSPNYSPLLSTKSLMSTLHFLNFQFFISVKVLFFQFFIYVKTLFYPHLFYSICALVFLFLFYATYSMEGGTFIIFLIYDYLFWNAWRYCAISMGYCASIVDNRAPAQDKCSDYYTRPKSISVHQLKFFPYKSSSH